jgi:DNA-binding transcriptional LysR family regulator
MVLVRHRNLNHLVYFHEVVESGSITEAARRLSVTPPTVSVRLAALEHQLGELLFDRVHGRLRLNAAGRRVHVHTARILRELDAIFDRG